MTVAAELVDAKPLPTKRTQEKPKPFIKWAGGKRQLISAIKPYLPQRYNRYFEPMIGGGALFFHLTPTKAYIADINEELINLYLVVRDRADALIEALAKHRHDKEYFYEIRNVDRSEKYLSWSPVQRASRFIYLNRTCFNGLYRVNSKGQFNVPFGDYKNPRIVDHLRLRTCSAALQKTEISLGSFEQIRDQVRAGDFVYFDPPYVPLTASSNFTSYSKEGFDEAMQTSLRDFCIELDRKNIKFMLSNSSAPFVLDLYKGFNIRLLDATRAINSVAKGRGKVKEALVTNY